MAPSPRQTLRRILPFAVSIGAMVYVFGYAIDPGSLPLAGEDANLPLFIALTVLDKLVFFLGWAWIQWKIIDQFIEPVPMRDIIAVKGGSELVRAVSPQLADAAFFLGLTQVVRNRIASIMAVALVPAVAQSAVLLLQATLAWPFLEGDNAANRDVAVAILIGWAICAGIYTLGRLGIIHSLMEKAGLERLHSQMSFRN